MTIENFYLQLANDLGSDFQTFYNSSERVVHDQARHEVSLGVFSVAAGEITPLTAIQGLRATCEFTFYINTDADVSRKARATLDRMIGKYNGNIFSITDDDGTKWTYFASMGLLTTAGSPDVYYGTFRQPFYLSMTLTYSAAGGLGSDITLKVDGEVLQGITSFSFDSDNALLPDRRINRYVEKNYTQYGSFALSVTGYRTTDALQDRLQRDAMMLEQQTYALELTVNSITRSYRATAQYHVEGTRGGFQTVHITFAEVNENG